MMNILIKYKKVLTILLIVIVLFLAIFLPIYFLVIKKSSESSEQSHQQIASQQKVSPCTNQMVTIPDQPQNNLIKNNMMVIPTIDNTTLKSLLGMKYMLDIINNTENRKPCYDSWFNTENTFMTLHNEKRHKIKSIEIIDTFIIITFEENTLNDINPFPLHIHAYNDCINNKNSCDYRNEIIYNIK